MIRYILIICLSLNTYSFTVKLPRTEAIAYLLVSQDIPTSKNYHYEIDFHEEISRITAYIHLKSNGVENFEERNVLANTIIKKFEKIIKRKNINDISFKIQFQ